MSTHDESLGPEGYRVDAVEAWIAEHIEQLTPPLKWTRLEGGHSNLTYRIEDTQGRCAVIRRPPQGELLPKAHDMSREWALISALGPTPVPVPAARCRSASTKRTNRQASVALPMPAGPVSSQACANRPLDHASASRLPAAS